MATIAAEVVVAIGLMAAVALLLLRDRYGRKNDKISS